MKPRADLLVGLGATAAVLSGAALLMLHLGRSSFSLAVVSALIATFVGTDIERAYATFLDGQFPLVYPVHVGSFTAVFTCWGVGMAFALGLASRRRIQWAGAALASVATVPLLGALFRASGSQNPGAAPDYLYPTALIVGFGLYAAILSFYLGSAVRRATGGRPGWSRPIGLIAGAVCGLQLLVLATAATRHVPPLWNVGGVVIGLVTVGPVLYISSRMGIAWIGGRRPEL